MMGASSPVAVADAGADADALLAEGRKLAAAGLAALDSAPGVAKAIPVESLVELEDAGLWRGGQLIDGSCAVAACRKLLGLDKFLRQLAARHRQHLAAWCNLWQRGSVVGEDEREVEELLGPELMAQLKALATSITTAPTAGQLAGPDWVLDAVSFVLNPPGSQPQFLHVDYNPYQFVGMINITAPVDPRAATHYLVLSDGIQRTLDAMSARGDGEQVDIDRLLLDHPGGVVTSLRGPTEPFRPFIIKGGTLHRGAGNPDTAPFRIAFCTNFLRRGDIPLGTVPCEPVYMTEEDLLANLRARQEQSNQANTAIGASDAA